MSFNPKALNERTLKQFVDRLCKIRKGQPIPTEPHWPPKRSSVQEDVAQMLGFTSWHHAIHSVRPSQSTPQPSPSLYPFEPVRWTAKELDRLLSWINFQGASDIVFDPHQGVVINTYGNLSKVSKRIPSNEEIVDLIEQIYASPTVRHLLENFKEVDFAYVCEQGDRFIVNATPIQSDPDSTIILSLRPAASTPPDLSQVYEDMPAALYSSLFPHQGMVLVSGQAGSGKTTLISSIIKELATTQSGRKVVMYESPIEYSYNEIPTDHVNIITQTDIAKAGLSYPQAIRNSLRRRPSIIVLGETRDGETLGEAVTAAMTGHTLYTTVHSNDVPSAIRRQLMSFDASERAARFIDLISVLRVVVCTRLVPATNGTRVALHESLVFSDELVDEIIDTGIESMTQTVRKAITRQRTSFLDDALDKYKSGKISAATLEKIKRSS